jgi:prevent-host-death family protein
MKEAAATEAKNRFGQLLDTAMTEPVAIEKKGRPVAVLLSFTEYQRLVELEDRYWGQKAQYALEKGFLSVKETSEWLKGKLSAETSGK